MTRPAPARVRQNSGPCAPSLKGTGRGVIVQKRAPASAPKAAVAVPSVAVPFETSISRQVNRDTDIVFRHISAIAPPSWPVAGRINESIRRGYTRVATAPGLGKPSFTDPGGPYSALVRYPLARTVIGRQRPGTAMKFRSQVHPDRAGVFVR